MIATLLFTAIAALLVFLAGRGDEARDPRLTVLALVLLAVFPLSVFLPKAAVFPVPAVGGGGFGFPLQTLILGIWAMGFVVASVRLVIAAVGISRWRDRSKVVGMIRGVELRQLEGLRGPVAAGVFRPMIFLPSEWSSWPVDTRRMILDHELAHHHRRDPLWRWIAEIACAIHGWNPLVIWISRRLAMQCEFACDATVLRNGSRADDYARLLCEFAVERPPAGPALAMAVSSSLESRVIRMMAPKGDRGSAPLVVLIVLALAFAGALASFGPSLRDATPIPPDELDLRWSADPFPGES